VGGHACLRGSVSSKGRESKLVSGGGTKREEEIAALPSGQGNLGFAGREKPLDPARHRKVFPPRDLSRKISGNASMVSLEITGEGTCRTIGRDKNARKDL